MRATQRTIDQFVQLFEKDCQPALRETHEIFQMKKIKAKTTLVQKPNEFSFISNYRRRCSTSAAVKSPQTPVKMDANGMLQREDTENSIDEENRNKFVKAIDEYQYRLINNNRTP